MNNQIWLKDEEFIRGNIPMTKESIRNLSVLKLGLNKESILYDVGAGTGSISIVAALFSGCEVYSFERKNEGIQLIKENSEKFQVSKKVHPVLGLAPTCFLNVMAPSHVFIGGSSGNLYAIIEECLKMPVLSRKKGDTIRFVMNAVSLETIAEMQGIPKHFGEHILNFEVEAVSVAKAKQIGEHHLMMAENPVYICSFDGIKYTAE